MTVRMKQRRGTAALWTSTNPTLLEGQIGFETDTGKFKFGDGVTAWASLGYAGGVGSFQPLDSDLTAIAALTTTTFGRALLALADDAAGRAALGLGTAATISSTAGGDLSGTLPSPTVAKINGVAVTGTPADGYVPTATSATTATWQSASSSGGSQLLLAERFI